MWRDETTKEKGEKGLASCATKVSYVVIPSSFFSRFPPYHPSSPPSLIPPTLSLLPSFYPCLIFSLTPSLLFSYVLFSLSPSHFPSFSLCLSLSPSLPHFSYVTIFSLFLPFSLTSSRLSLFLPPSSTLTPSRNHP